MKFGLELNNALHPEWKFYYVDYDQMKRMLKTKGTVFAEDNEALFIGALEAELDKVASFCAVKADELERRVQHCEKGVAAVVDQNAVDQKKANILNSTSQNKAINLTSQNKAINSTSQNNEHDTDLSYSQTDRNSSFARVEEHMDRITSEVAELYKFIRLNYSGFIKILKKHDKHTTYKLKTMFMVRLNARPFYRHSFDSLIIRLSKLYDTVRTGGQRVEPAAPSGTSFVRRTTKYWVHPDNVTEVKIHVLKQLPVSVFAAKRGNEPDPAITSIYFDNEAFDLYLGRLEKSQGAQALRLRWYGSMDQTEIFVERKTHHEDWTGESSIKERFPIKEKHVNAFLRGDYTINKTADKLKTAGKSEKECEGIKQLGAEVQESIKARALHPIVRTFYNRTAFQLPGDARVRISLDTELTMIREDNFGGDRSGQNWRRMDAGTIAPFAHLPKEDVSAFPYAVLEVKLQTQHGTTAPAWVQELINSHLVEEVPKFSKYIHGVATLLESRVSLLPFWLPQMDKDIRKTAAKNSIAGPIKNRVSFVDLDAGAVHEEGSGKTHKDLEKSKEEESSSNEHQVLNIDAEDDENTPLISKPATIRSKGKSSMFASLMRSSSNEQPATIPTLFNQKRIILPVRVEPKVFFANERTFLSWLHFCIVLGGLALGLLNFGDPIAQISGAIFTVVSMIFMFYALYLYQWRAHKIRIRGNFTFDLDSAPYDDRFGPVILVFTLFFAVCVNFYLKFTSMH